VKIIDHSGGEGTGDKPNPEIKPNGADAKQCQAASANEGTAFGFSWRIHWHGEAPIEDSRPQLVQGLLPETGAGLISGQWGTYKTFVAIDLSVAVMTGTDFVNFPVRRKGGVLFIACEGQSEVAIRLAAACEARGLDKAPFAWIEKCPRLLDPNAAKILAQLTSQVSVKMMREFGLPVVLVFIDTVGRAAGYTKTGDENDAALARQVMKALADASANTGALFMGLAHFGKNIETGTKGSSDFENDADVVLALLGEKGLSGAVTNPRLSLRKRRSGPNGEEFAFRTKVADLGLDEHGFPITTLTIEWHAGAETMRPKADAWSKSLRLLRQVLMNMLADAGKDIRPFSDGPVVRGVDQEIVRAEFYKSYPADGDAKAKQNVRRQAFGRALKDAQAKGLIGIREIETVTYVWLAAPIANA
jgi:AAA domain